jgi:hypothetical protein
MEELKRPFVRPSLSVIEGDLIRPLRPRLRDRAPDGPLDARWRDLLRPMEELVAEQAQKAERFRDLGLRVAGYDEFARQNVIVHHKLMRRDGELLRRRLTLMRELYAYIEALEGSLPPFVDAAIRSINARAKALDAGERAPPDPGDEREDVTRLLDRIVFSAMDITELEAVLSACRAQFGDRPA